MSDYNPFKELKKLKIKPKRKQQPAQPKPAPQPKREATEEDLFSRYMSGVAPLEDGKGRDVAAATKPAKPPAQQDPEDEAARRLREVVESDVDFEWEFTDEFMYAHVRGLDMKIFRQLKAGSISMEGHLDMHGMTAEQAYDNLLFFMNESYLAGRRAVLLIPGRGKGSPAGMSVLKQELQHWLTREPLKRMLLAFCTALPKHGGAGAVYVLLRKHKKTQGKVQWDRSGL